MKINANGTEISVVSTQNLETDYISLTDLARKRNPYEPKDVVRNWLRLRSTIEFLGLWEELNNPNFKGVEFDAFKNEAGSIAYYQLNSLQNSNAAARLKANISNQIEQK